MLGHPPSKAILPTVTEQTWQTVIQDGFVILFHKIVLYNANSLDKVVWFGEKCGRYHLMAVFVMTGVQCWKIVTFNIHFKKWSSQGSICLLLQKTSIRWRHQYLDTFRIRYGLLHVSARDEIDNEYQYFFRIRLMYNICKMCEPSATRNSDC